MPDDGKPASAAALVERLRQPACYPHAPGEVAFLETHISWVFLAGPFAYKVKKPVQLDFLDFRALESRKRFCEEELRLNRRTAPSLYLGVVPITGTPDAPKVEGEGDAIEYAVKMRRFPQDALLDRVARAGKLTAAHVEELARSVAAFHAAAARCEGPCAYGTPPEILAEAVDNFAAIEREDDGIGARPVRQWLCSWTLREFNRLEPAFAARRRLGYVRECHGDLHLGNVALLDGHPVPFDAIEFNEAFRHIDVMSEVAFPVMDLHHHGLAAHAHRFVDAWLDSTGDYAGLALLRFYLVYRAMVRAKIACIRAAQNGISPQEHERARQAHRGHLALAERLSRLPRTALVVMHGLSGSGKSTVSQGLVDALGAIRLRSDVERKRLFGLPVSMRSGSLPGGGLYTREADHATYSRLATLADLVLAAGDPVVVDATFLHRHWREAFRELARERHVPFVLVGCAAPEETLRERIVQRGDADASEANLAVLQRQKRTLEPLADAELDRALIVETAGATPVAEAVETVRRRINGP